MSACRRTATCHLALACAAVLALGACSAEPADETGTDASEQVSTDTLSALIAQTDDLERVEELMSDVGLSAAFDGNAPYTIFAPTDDALAALGEDFEGQEARPALLAVLREHIVPGYLTVDDIAGAIEANGGPVEMQTMGEGTLTFSAQGGSVTVTATGGEASATLGDGMRGTNGVVIPVDTVLKDLQPT